MRYFHPFLNTEKPSVFASLCARIGSISDNRLGGWHSYRASKAALCMMMKTFSIELARTNKSAICVTIHPGTVDSPLSKPFQKYIAPESIFTPKQSVTYILNTLSELKPEDTGHQIAYDGTRIPF